jgi:tRNA(Arg) A34 adenosine deaminase TadA
MPGAPPRPTPQQAEQIAWQLGAPAVEVAFLRAHQGIYFARAAAAPALSPVFRLIAGIHELEPERARWIVRNRIFSTAPMAPAALGAARVAARHMTGDVAAIDHGLALDGLPRIDAGAALSHPRRCDPGLLPRLAELVAGDATPRLLGRLAAQAGTIAALLLGPAGELLSWATSTGSRNPTGHAEANLVGDWLARTRSPLPVGSRVLVTLKPCKMCAGLLWEAAADPWSLRVVYAEDDPLRYARETVLDAGSMARRRVACSPEQLARVLQVQASPPAC